MKTVRILLTLTALALTTISFAETTPINKTAITVNNEIITESEYLQHKANLQRYLEANGQTSNEEELSKLAKQNLIHQALKRQQVKRMKIEVSNAEVDAAITQELEKRNMSKEAFRVELTKEGSTYDKFWETMKQRIAEEELELQIMQTDKPKISAEEIEAQRKLLEKLPNAPSAICKIRQYLYTGKATDSSDTAKKIADKIRSNPEVKLEDEFPNLEIKDWKEDRCNALPDDYNNALKGNEKTGWVSSPIKTSNGYHIIELLSYKGSNVDLTQLAKQQLLQQAGTKAVEKWLKQAEKQSYINVVIK